ncbi:MAG: Ig-like domain-containing protein [Ruminococcus sp.]|nr:Ig-like domain-containing protein [Ruminococcus sp.]
MKMLQGLKSRLAAIAVAAAVLCSVSVSALAENTSGGLEISGTQIIVRSSEIKEKGTYKAVQSALDIARYSATNDNIYRVVVEPGEYDLTRALHIYSNTELYLKNVKLTRNKKSSANMLRTGDYDTENSGATGYDEYCNMTVTGGVFDGSGTANTMIKAAHCTNLTFRDAQFKNVRNGHIMEIAGVDGFNVTGCDFLDQKLDPDDVGYEAIQLDILKSGHIVDCRSEDLAMKNVNISGCTFENVPRGVGTHTMILNNPFENIKIKNNTFTNITSAAIQTMNWKNCEISGNTIQKAPRGISVYSLLGKGHGAYKAGTLAKEGKTDRHVGEGYSGPFDSNISIHDNTITDCGDVKDKFASYEPAGITVTGVKLSKVYSTYDDGSGALPKGDYSVRGVAIKNNTIDVNGYGIRMITAKDCEVYGNTLQCGGNKNYGNDFHGIQVYESSLSLVKKNSVSGAACNGISVYKSTVPVIEHNEIDNSKNYGICCDSSTVRHINYNTIIKTSSDGILFKASNGNKKITENYITNTGGRGIFIKTKSKAGAVTRNTIFGCKGVGVEKMNNSKGSIDGNYFKAAELTSIALNTNSLRLGKGETYPLSMTLSPSNAKSKFIWTSSNNSVATVDGNGKVKAKSLGKATITVRAANDIEQSCAVEVKPAPDSVALNASMLTLGEGEEFDLNSSLSPKGCASYRVKYTSNNTGSVGISSTGGVITGRSVGTATIIAKTFNGKLDNCNVIVKAAPYAVWFEEDYLDLGKGESYSFEAKMPAETATHYLKFESSNPEAVAIDPDTGYAEAKGYGTAEITATAFNGMQAHCTVTVKNAPESVDMAAATIGLSKGDTCPVTCTFPEGSTACNITFTSSDPSVCHVDKQGVVTAKSKGKATVAARTYNGRIAFCEVTVQ